MCALGQSWSFNSLIYFYSLSNLLRFDFCETRSAANSLNPALNAAARSSFTFLLVRSIDYYYYFFLTKIETQKRFKRWASRAWLSFQSFRCIWREFKIAARQRAKVKVRDFCYASLTGVLKRFQKDWKFIRACVVVNPKDEVMLETKPHVAEYINEIFDFVEYFGRFGPEYRRVIEAEAARFYRNRCRYPGFIGIFFIINISKSTQAKKKNPLPGACWRMHVRAYKNKP